MQSQLVPLKAQLASYQDLPPVSHNINVQIVHVMTNCPHVVQFVFPYLPGDSFIVPFG